MRFDERRGGGGAAALSESDEPTAGEASSPPPDARFVSRLSLSSSSSSLSLSCLHDGKTNPNDTASIRSAARTFRRRERREGEEGRKRGGGQEVDEGYRGRE